MDKNRGGCLWHLDHVPEMGKYNTGQEMFSLTVVFFEVIMFYFGLIIALT
jgi:formate dehydrogenase subunit gamma